MKHWFNLLGTACVVLAWFPEISWITNKELYTVGMLVTAQLMFIRADIAELKK